MIPRLTRKLPFCFAILRPVLLCLGLLLTALPSYATNTFSATGPLASGRYKHTATLLPNGMMLVTGGFGNSQGYGQYASAELYNQATGTWSATSSMATGRFSHAATLLPNGKVLVMGGYGNSLGYGPNDELTSAELYDPATGTWSATGPLATRRQAHTATLLSNGKVLVVGGYNSAGSSADAELYDPATGIWSVTGSLSSVRYNHTATLLPNGKVLVVGGYNGTSHLGSSELYDPATGTWSATGSLANGRYRHTATLLPSGQVLVAGGATGSTSAELYNPATGTWNTTGPLATARFSHTATLLPNGRVLLMGGSIVSGYSNLVIMAELYDPATGNWSTIGSNTTGRRGHTATLLPNGKLLVVGGYDNFNASAIAELFESDMGIWEPTGPLATARRNHTSTLLPNGKVLTVGGSGSNDTSAELYDPATGTWGATGSLISARFGHTATLLANGKLLVAGGSNSTSAELYDPATGTWSATWPLFVSRVFHTATLLANGKVLVVGGSNSTSAELYDPATGTWTSTGSSSIAHSFHTATLLPNGQVLVVGGASYNNGLGLVVSSAELYDPATGTWSSAGFLTTARSWHSATLLPNGKVLVAGGYTNGGNYSTAAAELYDPSTGAWTATSPLASARAEHTATLLPNGKVLVGGGTATRGLFILGGITPWEVANSELYDPASGTWSNTAPLTTARRSHKATLLPNGKVLFMGGLLHVVTSLGFAESITVSAEVYDDSLAFTPLWQPVIGTASLNSSGAVVLTGTSFRGISGASGSATNDSSTNYPVVQIRRLDNEQISFLLSNASINTSATNFASVPLIGQPAGHYMATVFTNGIPSTSAFIVFPTPDYSITTVGGIMTVTDLSSNSDTLILSEPATGSIKFAAAGRTFSLNGSPLTTGDSGNIPLTGITSIVVNAAAGNNTINTGAFSGSMPSLTLNGGAGNDTINLNGSIIFAANAILDVDLQNDSATPGFDRVNVYGDANISGTGTITVRVSRSVEVLGGRLRVADGALTVEANQQTVSSVGTFSGVVVDDGRIQSVGTGPVTVRGRHGENASGQVSGVDVNNHGSISSTSSAVGAGTILLEGAGSSGTKSDSLGVRVLNGGAIAASAADISIVGSTITGNEAISIGTNGTGSVESGGNLTLTGDSIAIHPTNASLTAGNTIFLGPLTNGRPVNLGAVDSPSTLGLTNDELKRLTVSPGGSVLVGNNGNASGPSGPVIVSDEISPLNYQVLRFWKDVTFTATGGFVSRINSNLSFDKMMMSGSGATTVTITPGATLTLLDPLNYTWPPGYLFLILGKTSGTPISGTFTLSTPFPVWANYSSPSSGQNLTVSLAVVPTVITSPVSGLTTTSADMGGQVTSDGGAAIAEQGIVWSTATIPTNVLPASAGGVTKVPNGNNPGVFTATIGSLPPLTQISYRAYAINQVGYSYGPEVVFTTPAGGAPDPVDLNIVGTAVTSAVVQPDGKTILIGAFSSIGGVPRSNIARLNADDTVDLTFDPNANGNVSICTLLADGRMLVGGNFTYIGGQSRQYLARLDQNGVADGFDPNPNAIPQAILVQRQIGIVIGGRFTNIGGVNRSYLARYDSDILDTDFPQTDNWVETLAEEADGNLLIGGRFTTIGGQARPYLARTNKGGDVDLSFAPGLNNLVLTAAVQAGGQILVGGTFTNIAGIPCNRIARLSANGSVDTSLIANLSTSGGNNWPVCLSTQTDGKILVGGFFTSAAGSPRNRVARFNADSSLDTYFDPAPDAVVTCVSQRPDGRIWLTGQFNNLQPNGGATVPRHLVARLYNDPATQTLSVPTTSSVNWARSGAGPEIEQVTFEISTSTNGLNWAPLGSGTRVPGTGWALTGLNLPPTGILRARGRTTGHYESGSSGIIEQKLSYSLATTVPVVAVDWNGPQSSQLTTLVNFTGTGGTNPGAKPLGSLIQASDGALYATTRYGGANGHGTVFKMGSTGLQTTLVHFSGNSGSSLGAQPYGNLLQGSDGNFYGTTSDFGISVYGKVFKMTPSGVYTMLVSSVGGNMGYWPVGSLIQGSDEAYYGTTLDGGYWGAGVVFKMTSTGVYTLLANIGTLSGSYGVYPHGSLIQTNDGTFYGMTEYGGTNNLGTVFKVTPAGNLTTLVNFTGTSGTKLGSRPHGDLLQVGGDFYGMTLEGGSNNLGSIFKMTASGVVTTLVNFTGTAGSNPGSLPQGSLVRGSDGFLYGLTTNGGSNNFGTAFKMTTSGVLTTLVSFTGNSGANLGSYPHGNLLQANDGAFYGTTSEGGTNNVGTVFKLSPGTTTPEGSAATQTGTFADPNGNATVTLTASSGTITQNNATGTWSWTATGSDGPATSTVTITATDSSGNIATAPFTFSVTNVPPTVVISAPATGVVGASIGFTFTATDVATPDQTAGFTWSLDYGDGTAVQALPAGTASPLARTHSFATAGTYTVTATATDKDGGMSLQASKTIIISTAPPNTAPSFNLATDAGAAWTPHYSSEPWFDVASSADGNKLVAIENIGYIYTSTDAGVNWTPRGTSGQWGHIVSSADGTKLATTEYAGSIYTSNDSGVTWTARMTDAPRYWYGIASSADGTKLFASEYGGYLYTSIDSGATWTACKTDANRNWYGNASSADGTKLAAIVNSGEIYTSTDSGATWAVSGPTLAWTAITSSADGTKLAATAANDQIYTSTDSGATWTARESNRAWYAIASSADGSKLAAATNGLIYTSADSGVSWTPRASSAYWHGIASSADGSKLVAVANGGQIHTSAGLPSPSAICCSGPASIPAFAINISPGPVSEAAQTVTFTVTNDNNSLFTVQPAIAPDGTLTFTPGCTGGTAIVTVVAVDNGGTANGGIDTSAPQTFTITIKDPLEDWRMLHFGSTADSGDSANTADPDHDGLANLIEFAFGLNPNSGSSLQTPPALLIGGNLVSTFTEPSGMGCITYEADWSTDLIQWFPIPDTGTGNTHIFSVPVGSNPKMFLRHRITEH